MSDVPQLRTERLLLREWQEQDREPFAALNADPEVTEYLAGELTRQASDAMVDRIIEGFAELGFGLWAVEVMHSREFIGFTGLSVPSFEAHFTPAVEVGWRLARSAWGRGYATEAALAALDFGFTSARLDEVVSFTTATNVRSRAVMRRVGMTTDPGDDFAHPRLVADHPLRPHVLYRLSADRWRQVVRRR